MAKKNKNPADELKTKLYQYATVSATDRHARDPFLQEPKVTLVWDGANGSVKISANKKTYNCINKADVKRAFKAIRIEDARTRRLASVRLFPGEAA